MVSSILPKNERKKNWVYYCGTSSRIVFVRFLGELKIPKIHFEINWPLPYYVLMSVCGYEENVRTYTYTIMYNLWIISTSIDILCENCKCKRKIPGGDLQNQWTYYLTNTKVQF